ncbi:hypothetical protein LVD15_23335 [Fulvivirga maritima]|uniref:hypothetical protein n=1 Tax=Fulvivirga maritima TaxID=2904247 RepID=UPI001F37FDFB|nr:hypothetical protein [Fulvivirga maritima]UII26203.1 hypothetical protein LVD15_23335 [Fulvivirga maritima]
MSRVYGTLRVNLLDRHKGTISLKNSPRYGGGFDGFDFNIGLFKKITGFGASNPVPFNFMGYGTGTIHITKPKPGGNL